MPGPVSALILGNGSESYGTIWRVKLDCIPCPILPYVPTLLRCRHRGTGRPWKIPNPFTVVALGVATKSAGHSFQAMAQSAVDKIPPGPQLDALTAQKVFGWKNIHKHEGEFVGKKQVEPGAGD
jgi:hypothetical protein